MLQFPKIKKDSFLHNFGIIFSGNLINQVILVITYPIIARLYLPSQFGLFAQLQAIFNILILISTLKYDQAIIITKTDDEERNLISLSFYILIMVTLLATIAVVIFTMQITNFLKNQEIRSWLFLLPIFTFLGGMQLILNNISTKHKKFKISNYSNILMSSSNSFSKVIFGFLNFSAIGLFFSRLLSYFFAVSIFFMKKVTITVFTPTKQNLLKMKKVAYKYKEFPLYMNSSVFINIFSMSILTLMISRFWDITILGFFSMANSTLNLPIVMIRKTFQTVFYQRASEHINNKPQLKHDLKKLTLTLLLAFIIPVIIVFFWGENIYTFAFGEKWVKTGEIAGYIFPWLATSLISTPATVLIPILNLQKYFLIFQSFIFVTRIGLLIIVYYFSKDFILAFKLLSVHGILLNTFHFFYIRHKLR